jgi:hypothetical protein
VIYDLVQRPNWAYLLNSLNVRAHDPRLTVTDDRAHGGQDKLSLRGAKTMKMIWMLAAAASLAACHNKSEETGAAPDRGDTTAVAPKTDTTMADTTMKADTTKADTTGAYAPSAGVDTTQTQPAAPTDTTQNQAPPPAAAPSDTSSMSVPADTTQPPSPSSNAPSDSAAVNPTDTTSGQPK